MTKSQMEYALDRIKEYKYGLVNNFNFMRTDIQENKSFEKIKSDVISKVDKLIYSLNFALNIK